MDAWIFDSQTLNGETCRNNSNVKSNIYIFKKLFSYFPVVILEQNVNEHKVHSSALCLYKLFTSFLLLFFFFFIFS